MKCPSCEKTMEEASERCPHCKLTLQKLDIKFGIVPAHSRFLSDRSGTLAVDDLNDLRAALRLFQTKFPQTLFSILVTELPAQTSVAEYAFWLANRGKFSSVEFKPNESFNVLLVIDLTADAAALTVGYSLERFVPEGDLRDVLDDLAKGMAEAGLTAGLRACIDSLTRRLRELSDAAQRTRDQEALV